MTRLFPGAAAWVISSRATADVTDIEDIVIILGIILIALGFALGISDLGIIGTILLIIGAIFWSLRAISRVIVSQLGAERHEDRMRRPNWSSNIGAPLYWE
jgi:hypothetical protein